jgi:mevalonate kinase
MLENLTEWRANGKLLLTGEYFVLDGVPALAVPTKLGQSFTVDVLPKGPEHDLYWLAYDKNGDRWFSRAFDQVEWAQPQVHNEDSAARILQILHAAESLNTGCTKRIRGVEFRSRLEFERKWGLGSSSTLIAAVAYWLEVNPYELLERTFGGSGYDLACAIAQGPILYERNGSDPKVADLNWKPEWVKQTHFVYRNQKQNSREGIRAYRAAAVSEREKKAIGEITSALLDPTLHLRAAAQLLRQHETLVAETLGMQPIQEELFPDFPGQLKSLGAWGGDFIWALSEESPEKVRAYFNERGYETVINYEDMVL